MKRILSIAIIAIMALANVAHAEENKGGNVEFEITGGVQAATISYGTIVSRVGFHAGLRASKDFKFFTPENAIYGNVAALISLKGGKLENDEGKTVYNPYYLEIPIHAGYSHVISENAKFYFEMGPYFAVGLFGKTDDKTVFDDLNFRRFDFGLGLRTGVDFYKHLSLGLGYDVGLINVQKGTGANKNFYVSAGYKF
ncbi:MAG: porin family protein [Sodaliphilus sp.]|nr:porin family protein [Sodaliphilus sp.]MDY5878608.1 porin family protein [Sodaliphilus sp.]